MVVPIVNIERFEFGQRPGLRAAFFCDLIWRNVILSLLNKVYINSGTVRRHSSGVINN
jgi:hypothetical protein